jgi:hypothetical protein
MKNALRLIAGLCLLLTFAIAPAFAQGQGSTQPWALFEKELGLQTTYSVDMVIQSMGTTMDSHIDRDGDKTRTEMTMPMMNLQMVMLELPEDGQTAYYTLFPEKKKYAANEMPPDAEDPEKPVIEELGTETYEGVECVKRSMVMKMGPMESDMTMLFSPEQKDMPVKMTVKANMSSGPGRPAMPIETVILFKNYTFSTPDTGLFEIPADYAKAASVQEIMMESMGGMMAPPPQ